LDILEVVCYVICELMEGGI